MRKTLELYTNSDEIIAGYMTVSARIQNLHLTRSAMLRPELISTVFSFIVMGTKQILLTTQSTGPTACH